MVALKTGPIHGKRAAMLLTTRQNGEVAERLGRLRRELKQISPRPETAGQARDAILAAMARANLGDWTIPDLCSPSAVTYRDGTVRVNLIAHAIFFNPWGAFRLVELRLPETVYFELGGAQQRGFSAPG